MAANPWAGWRKQKYRLHGCTPHVARHYVTGKRSGMDGQIDHRPASPALALRHSSGA
ncbi:hypothetical protein ACGFW5_20095 [Streptomyces sp. NPDC048416]|uniref:hypothetical protein n=1 Tax=Streptomyces sp. NPDC048416 TaxID=3365546 RepID=UPI00370FC490